MPLSVRSLGSGSSGNCLLIDAGQTVVAIDCGIGIRAIAAGLKANGRTLSDLSAVLVSHEHTDHARSLPALIQRQIPVVATAGTARALALTSRQWEAATPRRPLRVHSLSVTALPVSHDAADPCGFFIETAARRIVVVTDLGQANATLREAIGSADLIVIEANHDIGLLRRGPYPAHLKRRVLSTQGHLSNTDAGLLIADAVDTALTPTVWLAHLSRTNNRPDIATSAVKNALLHRGRAIAEITALSRHGHEQVWTAGIKVEGTRQMTLPLT